MSPFEKHHQLTPDQHVEAVNARWQLRSRVRDIRQRYQRSLVMCRAFENLATGAYTPHQYEKNWWHSGDWFPETYNPDDWEILVDRPWHRAVFTFDPLPPPAVGDVSVLADALAQFMQDDE